MIQLELDLKISQVSSEISRIVHRYNHSIDYFKSLTCPIERSNYFSGAIRPYLRLLSKKGVHISTTDLFSNPRKMRFI